MKNSPKRSRASLCQGAFEEAPGGRHIPRNPDATEQQESRRREDSCDWTTGTVNQASSELLPRVWLSPAPSIRDVKPSEYRDSVESGAI